MQLGPGEPPAGPWRVVPLDDLVQLLLTRAGEPRNRPRIVAVDGRQGGGKSALTQRLAATVTGAQIVHTDDVAWFHGFFSWAELMADGVLSPLHRGEPVRYRPPAWVGRARDGAIVADPSAPVVFVEGVGAARRELMPFVDAVVWVQSDRSEADRRGIARDGGTPEARDFWYEWAAEEIPFLIHQRPWERADVVVCGTPAVAHGADEVVVAPPFDPR